MGSIYDEITAVSRRTMTLFFAVDTSGSMEGDKIGALNAAIEDVIPEIKKISEENADAQIKIAVIRFSNDAVWITPNPVDAEDFEWNYLEASGLTAFGRMCSELNSKLSRNEFMNDSMGSFAPVIFLLSDGEPTDEFENALASLRENNWFKKAIKAAVAIGNDANHEILQEFTGSRESVLTAHNSESMKKMIRFVSVTASQIGSQSSNVSADAVKNKQDTVASKQENFNKALSAFELEDVDDDELEW
ncbi:MAG: VWA domain-containing protein [Oscillospiraceae bacterium]